MHSLGHGGRKATQRNATDWMKSVDQLYNIEFIKISVEYSHGTNNNNNNYANVIVPAFAAAAADECKR